MENFTIETAKRTQAKLRIGLAAPSGGGKTYSALQLAYGLSGDWESIGIIDTEEGSASLYAHLGPFKVIRLTAPFTPERYIAALQAFEQAGMKVVIIDSITHVWKGEGGLLEYNASLGGKFQDWAKTTPRYQKFLQGILKSTVHVITTVRKKTAYAMITENGKAKIEKQGLDDEIRDGFEYELTAAFNININHLAEPSKDRTGLFMKADGTNVGFMISPSTGSMLKSWANEGKSHKPDLPSLPPTPVAQSNHLTPDDKEFIAQEIGEEMMTDFQRKKIFAIGKTLGKSSEETHDLIVDTYKLSSLKDLTRAKAAEIITSMMKKSRETVPTA